MHNYHGISSLSGDFFLPPLDIRKSSATGLKEGLCHQCQKWTAIQGDKTVNVEEIYWYKHAQKCHKYHSPALLDGESGEQEANFDYCNSTK
jgi:hypothetical protein